MVDHKHTISLHLISTTSLEFPPFKFYNHTIMKEKNPIIIYTVFSLLLILVISAGCSQRPQSSQPPGLPIFDEFSVTFPESISNTHDGVKIAEIHIVLANMIFDFMNTIVASAEGPTRVGLSWVWVSIVSTEVGEATYTIDGTVGIKGYNWIITINGTNVFGYYDNSKGIDGYSNFIQTYYSFNMYDPESPEAGAAAVTEYFHDDTTTNSLAMVYGYELLGTEFHSKFDIEQNSSGTGHVIGYWDEDHLWPEPSKYLELDWCDASSGTAEHGSWQTWWVPGVESLGVILGITITDETGAW